MFTTGVLVPRYRYLLLSIKTCSWTEDGVEDGVEHGVEHGVRKYSNNDCTISIQINKGGVAYSSMS